MLDQKKIKLNSQLNSKKYRFGEHATFKKFGFDNHPNPKKHEFDECQIQKTWTLPSSKVICMILNNHLQYKY